MGSYSEAFVVVPILACSNATAWWIYANWTRHALLKLRLKLL